MKDFQRFEISSSDKDLLVSAYKKDGENVVIMPTRSTIPREINLSDLPGVTAIEIANPYQENTRYVLTKNNRLKIEPGSIVTLL